MTSPIFEATFSTGSDTRLNLKILTKPFYYLNSIKINIKIYLKN